MSEQSLDIASLMQIEDLQNANQALASMVDDLQAKVEKLQERLELFYDCMRACPPQVGRPTQWRVHANRWPWTHAVGASAQIAIDAVLAESRRVFKDAPPDATPWQQADGWEGRQ
mgnify:CR=1 FL=1